MTESMAEHQHILSTVRPSFQFWTKFWTSSVLSVSAQKRAACNFQGCGVHAVEWGARHPCEDLWSLEGLEGISNPFVNYPRLPDLS